MTTQQDCSLGFKKETTYGTAPTVDRFLEFISESFDFDRKFFQGAGLRAGSRLARSGRRVMVADGGKGDIEIEVPTRGLGALLELLFGTAVSTQVGGTALYQQLFTLIKSDYLPSATFQKGLPRLGGEVVDPYTFRGVVAQSFEFSLGNADALKLKASFDVRDVVADGSIAYATPSYPSPLDLFTFVGASITIGGAVTVPTTTALATGGTAVADVLDFTVSVDQKNDDGGRTIGGMGKKTRRPAVGLAEVKGNVTAEYDAVAFRDAVANQSALSLVITFVASQAADITAGNKPTLQIVVPDIRFEGELPKSNGGGVITQKMDFTAFDGLVAAQPIYVVVRTADTAL